METDQEGDGGGRRGNPKERIVKIIFYQQTFSEHQQKCVEMEVAISGGGGSGKWRRRWKCMEMENA
jgi:hypothetical protein